MNLVHAFSFSQIAVMGTMVVTACSILHTFLPPWDFLSDFPKTQKVYKVVVYVVGYIAVNGRSTIYPSISTSNGTKISKAAMNGGSIDVPKQVGPDPGQSGGDSGGVSGIGTDSSTPPGK